jgi:hypothetical protein
MPPYRTIPSPEEPYFTQFIPSKQESYGTTTESLPKIVGAQGQAENAPQYLKLRCAYLNGAIAIAPGVASLVA